MFIGKTDAKAEAPIFWPPDVMSRLIGKDPPWCQERLKAGEEGEKQRMRWLDGIIDTTDFEQTPGDSEGMEAWHAAVRWVAKSQI